MIIKRIYELGGRVELVPMAFIHQRGEHFESMMSIDKALRYLEIRIASDGMLYGSMGDPFSNK